VTTSGPATAATPQRDSCRHDASMLHPRRHRAYALGGRRQRRSVRFRVILFLVRLRARGVQRLATSHQAQRHGQVIEEGYEHAPRRCTATARPPTHHDPSSACRGVARCPAPTRGREPSPRARTHNQQHNHVRRARRAGATALANGAAGGATAVSRADDSEGSRGANAGATTHLRPLAG
jgi:hypothetical protein